MRRVVAKEPFSRMLTWAQRALFARAVLLLGYCGFALSDAWNFQRRKSRDLDRLLRDRRPASVSGTQTESSAFAKGTLGGAADGLIGGIDRERADAGHVLPFLLRRAGGQAVRRASHADADADIGTVNGGMIESRETMERERLRRATAVPAPRILVIEDNRSDVFLLDRALKKQELRFELVHLLNGVEALAFIRRQGAYADAPTPNLILVDLNLSKYTGQDILREIRSAKNLGDVPVCVWSSSRSRRDEALLKNFGVSQFITKPAGLDQFMEIGKIIKTLLAAPKSR